MKYISVAEAAKRWELSARTVRNYCAQGKIPDAFLTGKTWNIPELARRPDRANKSAKSRSTLGIVLQEEKMAKIPRGIYQKLQIDLAYNSNHMEGNRLTQKQIEHIFETNTIGVDTGVVNVDDVVAIVNHFRGVDMVVDSMSYVLSETFIKQLHEVLTNGRGDECSDSSGDVKRNEQKAKEVKKLLLSYNAKKEKDLEEIIEFHYRFETMQFYQVGNGCIGRLILLKECLRNRIVPFIIEEKLKMFYHHGLREWKNEKDYLYSTCLRAQDKFKQVLDSFYITYS